MGYLLPGLFAVATASVGAMIFMSQPNAPVQINNGDDKSEARDIYWKQHALTLQKQLDGKNTENRDLKQQVKTRIDELLETERKYKLTQSDYAGEDTGREGEKQAPWSPEKSQRQQTFWRAAPHPALS